ncbi:uncharacterized protein BDV14DRAFT_174707 [Aspergillus stella-maris]|uniref:uncharacterized protein n=1 Tax=Aspergillus stella-maris TaxID=1810926 RepID=UPI003CCCA7A7
MKCDLRLPSCGTCVQLGAECCTTDHGLGENVPRSYIHSLQRQVERPEQQIQTQRSCTQRDSHHPPPADRQLPREYGYIGANTSVDLFD